MIINKDMAATAIVAASARCRGIGWKGDLPWKLPGDMKHFSKLTKTNGSDKVNAVIMGRNTWNSIPSKFRPLPGRTNVVLSSQGRIRDERDCEYPEDVIIASGLADAWDQLSALDNLGEIFVIGGARVYQEAIEQKYVHKVILTQVETPDSMEFDTFFPPLEDQDWTLQETSEPQQENGLSYKFQTFLRPNVQEEQYLDLIRKILKEGNEKGDRTGTGTKSIFGAQMRYDLRDGQLPLLTTKRTFWRGVAEELIWFISGSTNANLLSDKNVHIWDGNGSQEFLQSRGLGHREQGDLGPVYGFQWRHFGAEYKDMHADYTDKGVDQLAECIDKIKNNPEDRRIILSAWNPTALNEMALPPCHLMCQFYVDTKRNELSCHMYQRSADMGLGVPFNIASYALLTHLLAHVTGRKPGELVHTLGDAHVYLNHIEPLQEQLQRTPRPFPKLTINPEKKGIDDFVYEDLKVIGYHPYKSISMKMAV
jgi:dihydrofolate reductase/thymidylate synthase